MTSSISSCQERAGFLSSCPDPGPRPRERVGDPRKGPHSLLSGQRRVLVPAPHRAPISSWAQRLEPQTPQDRLSSKAVSPACQGPQLLCIPSCGAASVHPAELSKWPWARPGFQTRMCSDHGNEVSRKDSLPPFQKWGSVEAQRRSDLPKVTQLGGGRTQVFWHPPASPTHS